MALERARAYAAYMGLFALLATPYVAFNTTIAPVWVDAYVYLALGACAGVVGSALARPASAGARQRWDTAIAAAGAVLACAVTLPQWFAVGMRLACGLKPAIAVGALRVPEGVYLAAVMLASCCCAWLIAAIFTPRKAAKTDADTCTAPSRGAVLAAVAMGYAKQPVWFALNSGFARNDVVAWAVSCAASVTAALLMVVALRATCRAASQRGNAERTVRCLLAGGSLGFIFWHMVTRTVPIPDAAQLPLSIACLGMEVLIALFAARAERHHRRASHPASDSAACSEERRWDLSPYDLTDREGEAVALLLAGQTSAQAAEAMGLKASTVRVYLQRAYRKCGVRTADDLRALLCSREGRPAPSPAREAPQRHRGRFDTLRRASRAAAPYAPFVVLACLLTPAGTPIEPWGWGQGMLFAVASGLMLAAFVSCGSAPSDAEGPRAAQGAAILMFSLGCGATLALWLLDLGDVPLTFTPPPAVRYGAAVYMAYTSALRMIEYPPEALGRGWRAPTAALAVALLGAVAVRLRVIALMAGVAIMALDRVLDSGRKNAEGHPEHAVKLSDSAPEGFTLVLLMMVGFVAGLAFEEGWRALTVFSLGAAALPFVVAVLLGSGLLLAGWVPAAVMRTRAILVLAAFAVVSIVCLWTAAASVLVLAALGFMGLALHRCGPGPRPSRAVLAGSTGTGIAAACVVVNMCSDRLFLFNEVALRPYGGVEGVYTLFVYSSAALFVLGGAAALLLCIRLASVLEFQGVRAETDAGDMDRRILAYLASQGLNELQSQTLLRIMRGETSRVIASELGYSAGSINTARAVGYATLGVHSRMALTARVRREIGL